MEMNQWLDMGGYGIYVWPAYCITLLVFGINFLKPYLERNRIKKIIIRYWTEHRHES